MLPLPPSQPLPTLCQAETASLYGTPMSQLGSEAEGFTFSQHLTYAETQSPLPEVGAAFRPLVGTGRAPQRFTAASSRSQTQDPPEQVQPPSRVVQESAMFSPLPAAGREASAPANTPVTVLRATPAAAAARSPAGSVPRSSGRKARVLAELNGMSLRQLKKKLREVTEAKRAAEAKPRSPTPLAEMRDGGAAEEQGLEDYLEQWCEEEDWENWSEEEEEELRGGDGDPELCTALDKLGLLRGLPQPQGRHLRFNEEGVPEASPLHNGRVYLRGVPQAEGQRITFAEDD